MPIVVSWWWMREEVVAPIWALIVMIFSWIGLVNRKNIRVHWKLEWNFLMAWCLALLLPAGFPLIKSWCRQTANETPKLKLYASINYLFCTCPAHSLGMLDHHVQVWWRLEMCLSFGLFSRIFEWLLAMLYSHSYKGWQVTGLFVLMFHFFKLWVPRQILLGYLYL